MPENVIAYARKKLEEYKAATAWGKCLLGLCTTPFNSAEQVQVYADLNERLANIMGDAEKLDDRIQHEAKERRAVQQEAQDRATELTQLAFKACHDPDRLTLDDIYGFFPWGPIPPIGDFPGMMLDFDQLMCVQKVFVFLKGLNSRPYLDVVQDYARREYQCKYKVDMAQKLASLAQMSCNSPETLSSQTVKEFLTCFPNGVNGSWDGGPDCAHDLFNELMRYNVQWPWGQKLSHDWLVNEARSLNQKYAPHPSPQPQPQPGPQPTPPDPKPDRPDPHHHEPINPHPRMPYDPWHLKRAP